MSKNSIPSPHISILRQGLYYFYGFIFSLFHSNIEVKGYDLPQWLLEQIRKNRVVWFDCQHFELLSYFSKDFWEDLIELSKTLDLNIYIVCSPRIFSDKNNKEIISLFPKTLIERRVIRLFRSQNWQGTNSFFISNGNSYVTDKEDGRKGEAFFQECHINLIGREWLGKIMLSAIEIK